MADKSQQLMNNRIDKAKGHYINILDNIIYVIYFAIMLCIFCILIAPNSVDHIFRQNFYFSNFVLFLIGTIIACIALLIIVKTDDVKININKLTFAVFICLAYLSFNIAFEFDWDNFIVISNAQRIVRGDIDNLTGYYFSTYPNNFFILMIFTLILKIHNAIGIFTMNGNYMPVILFQCLLMSLAARTLYMIIYDMCKKRIVALIGLIVYIFSVTFSGWSVVTYSDQVGLLFPLLILRTLQLIDNKKHIFLKLLAIVLMSYISYLIKPTFVIPLIAIALYFLVHNIRDIKLQTLKYFARLALCLVIVIASYGFAKSKFIESSGLEIVDGVAISPWHFVMMGLNEETQGISSGPDFRFTLNTLKDGTNGPAQKGIALNRFHDYIKSGTLLKHYHKKALNNFDDGSFYWYQISTFLKGHFDDLNYYVAPFLKSIYLGKYSDLKKTFQQMIWITVLFVSLFAVFIKKNKEQTVMVLSLIGYVMFMMIFEAGPRPLMVYISYFIILAMTVLNRIDDLIKKKHTAVQ